MPISEPRASLKASLLDGAAYGLMLGIGEAYVAAYALRLGAPAWMIGLLSTAAPYLGTLAQVGCANLLESRPRRRPLYLAGSLVQLAMWPAILATTILPPGVALPVLLGAYVLYFGGAQFAGPAWNSAIGDLVPAEMRGRYFARRTRVSVLCQWVGTVAGGIVLQLLSERAAPALLPPSQAASAAGLGGFVAIFTVAFVARFASVGFLARMREPDYRPKPEDRFSLADFLRVLPKSNYGRFVVYVAALSLAATISAPYFTVYMLRDLKFTYTEYMGSQAVIIGGHVLSLYAWGPLGDRYGNKKVMAVCGTIVALAQALWLLDRNLLFVYAIQFVAGAGWSGFNLSAGNFILDAVTPAKRARCVAYFSLFTGTGTLLGGLAGAALVDRMPASLFGFELFSPIYGVILLSFVARTVVQLVFLPLFREVRPVEPVSSLGLIFLATHLRPVADFALHFLRPRRDAANGERPAAGAPPARDPPRES